MQEGVEGVLDLALSARMIPNLQVSMSQELRFHFNVYSIYACEAG